MINDEEDFAASRESESPKKMEEKPFFPDEVLLALMVIFLTLGVLITLTTFFLAPMAERADPFLTPEHIKPEWYYLWVYQLLKLSEKISFIGQKVPQMIGIVAPAIMMMVLIILPFLDKGKERHPRKRPIVTTLGILGIIFFIVLTIWGYYS
jgi:quinol-cytochrome oxidoreductase complex cytochrome b subunit